MVVYGAFRTASVQTIVTRKVAAHFGEKFNTVIEIQGVDIAFFNKVILEGLYIEDLHRDTLLYISKLAVGIRSIDRDIHKMVLDEIVLNHGVLNIRKYKGETVLNYKFLMAGQQGPGTPKPTWEFDVRTMDLRDLNFSYVDENRGATKSLMDLKNLHVSSFNAYLNESKWINNTLITQIEKLSLKEKSGFVIDNLSGKIKSSPVGLTASELLIVTPLSSLGGELSLNYTGYEDYKHFIDSVQIQADLTDTKVNLKDISFLAPALIGLDETVQLSGNIQGTIAKLKGKNIDLSYGEDTRFRGNLNLTGLPNFQETFIRFNVKKFSTSQKDLARLPAPPFDSGRIWKVPRYIRNLGRFNFVGDFTGFYNDFVAYGICESGLGVLVSDVSLTYNPITDQLHYEGQVSSSSFDVGRLLDAEKNVGVADFDINITGDGLNKNTAKAELDGLIKGITLKDYYYQNVELKGELQDKRFSGYLMAKDENLDFVFNGEIDYSASPPKFVFVADVLGANLDKLNLTTTLENPVFSVKVESNFFGKGIDDIQGEILLRDLKYRDANLQNESGFYPIGDISLMASEDNGKRKLQLHSEFVDADLEGAFNLQGLAGALFHSLHDMLPNSEHLSNLVASTKNHEHNQDFEYNILFKDVKRVLPIFNSRMSIADGTSLTGVFNSLENIFEAKLESQEIKIGDTHFDGVSVEVKLLPISDSVSGGRPVMELHSSTHIDEIAPGGQWSVADVAVSVDGKTNALRFATSWDNHTTLMNKGSVIGDITFIKGDVDNEIELVLMPTEIAVSDTLWTIAENNKVRFNKNYLGISGLKISSAVREFKINGSNATDNDEGIEIAMANIGLSAFEPLIGSDKVKLDGMLSGKASIYGLFSDLYATGEVGIKSLVFNGEQMGDANFNSSWRAGEKSVSISGGLMKNTLEIFSVLGSYFPKSEGRTEATFEADIFFNKFRLKPFQPFVRKVVSNISSSTGITGRVSLSGTRKKPRLGGKLNVQRAGFRIANLNTDYTFADEVLITNDALVFQDVVINDMKGNQAVASGKIMHKHFKDWSLDLEITADNVHSLNTDVELNNLYYGQAFATGDIKIYGAFDNISIDIVATTDKRTKINIPLTSTVDITEKSFIKFTNGHVTDTVSTSEEIKEVKVVSMPQIVMNIEATNDAEVQVIFDETVGDVMKVRGRGDLQFKVDRDGTFNMYGTYELRKGDYLFTLSGVINKRFKIEPGGTITWNGSPYDAIIDIGAIYKVNTSLYNLTGNDADKGRVRVECHLHLTGALMNPEIAFEIVFPDLDASASDVAWMFNTDQQVNRQVFSLLVLGQFQPSGSGELGLNGGAGGNPSELLSNQLSNWLSKISEDFDIGVNYRAGDEITEKEVEVALSTQLFDDRLKVDGSVANNSNAAAQNSSNIVGDFSLEYTLTKKGDLSLKAYNRANNAFVATTSAPYTQGVGVAYKKEFKSWKDLFGKMRKKKNGAEIKE